MVEDIAFPLGSAAFGGAPAQAAPVQCSARRCRAAAAFQLRWNNPKLHPPEARKTWLACPEHRESLSAFLHARRFLREVEPFPPVDEVAPAGPSHTHGPAEARSPDARPVDAPPADARPVDARPVDARPVDAQSSEARPAEAQSSDARSADAQDRALGGSA